MKLFNSLILFFSITTVFAQVGIGTESPQSSLDIRAQNHLGTVTAQDGILVPRVVNLSTDGSINGQLIFLNSDWVDDNGTTGNTSDDVSYITGFYYWNSANSLWTPIGVDTTIEPWYVANTTTPAASNADNIYTSGQVGIGTNNPLGALHITTTNSRDVLMFRFIDSPGDDLDIDLFRSRGTLTSPSLLVDDTRLGGLRGQSLTNPASYTFRPTAEIYFQTEGASSSTSSAGEINFATTPVGATSVIDRMTIKANGAVGINTQDPQETLHIDGSLRIEDGSEAIGKVLTSDASGTGTWEYPSINNVIGTLGTGVDIPHTTTGYLQTGSTITLPPGKFVVNVNMLISDGNRTNDNSNFWLRTTFADSNVATTPSIDILGSGRLISGNHDSNAVYSILSGLVIINNTSSADKTYYYIAGGCEAFNSTDTLSNFGGTAWSENNIIAYRID